MWDSNPQPPKASLHQKSLIKTDSWIIILKKENKPAKKSIKSITWVYSLVGDHLFDYCYLCYLNYLTNYNEIPNVDQNPIHYHLNCYHTVLLWLVLVVEDVFSPANAKIREIRQVLIFLWNLNKGC
jgi:hypothetical protein